MGRNASPLTASIYTFRALGKCSDFTRRMNTMHYDSETTLPARLPMQWEQSDRQISLQCGNDFDVAHLDLGIPCGTNFRLSKAQKGVALISRSNG
ncbi:hypothetical protein ACVWW1_000248 [Bradyrhizobium sp. JR3.5]